MTPLRHRTLGIALQEQGLLVVEARPSGKQADLRGAVRMDAPPESLPGGAAALAPQLRAFLKEHDLHGHRAVVGMPARWLVSREMSVPPVEPAQLAGLLRLRAEREIAADVGRLVADYSRAEDGEPGGTVLLVAMLQEHLDQVKAMCREAGLRLEAVVPTVMVLAAAAPGPGCRVVLNVGENATDVAIVTDGAFRIVREVPAAEPDALAGAVRRMLAPLGGPPGQVVVWGQAPEGLEDHLAGRLGMPVVAGESVATVHPAGGSSGRPFAGAAALALADSDPAARPVNFTASRLAQAHKFRIGRRAVWAAALTLTVLLAVGAVLYNWQQNKEDVAGLQAQLKRMQPQIDSATQLVDRVNQTRGWYDRRPPFLECLRALSSVFPKDGRIYAVSVGVSMVTDQKTHVESMQCVVTGKARDDSLVLKLVDALKASPQFANVKTDNLTGSQSADRTWSFAIHFTFVGSE